MANNLILVKEQILEALKIEIGRDHTKGRKSFKVKLPEFEISKPIQSINAIVTEEELTNYAKGINNSIVGVKIKDFSSYQKIEEKQSNIVYYGQINEKHVKFYANAVLKVNLA